MSGYYGQTREEMLAFAPLEARRVLELGCGHGRFAESLRQRNGAEVWGIERDPEVAADAAGRLDRVIVGDALQAVASLEGERFDLIVGNDLLEHLAEPERLLQALHPHFAPGGRLLLSLPNMRHYKVLGHLLFGRDWRYRDSGVLDRTHLRFFTRRSMLRMLEASGYRTLLCRGINGSRAPGLLLLDALLLGRHSDIRFVQFALLAAPAEPA
jgi:2-polyprenyl-3-methyl-5-hydroxy-6-metoxy-1,4-benzoquinol methylase